MIVIVVLVPEKVNQVKSFEKTFLMANICLEVSFKMALFNLCGANINFLNRELQ